MRGDLARCTMLRNDFALETSRRGEMACWWAILAATLVCMAGLLAIRFTVGRCDAPA